MKITLLTKYSRLGSSSRLRTLQYIPILEDKGFDICVQCLFDDGYLKRFYAGSGRSPWSVFRYYVGRIRDLSNFPRPDLLWVEKELFPYLPYWFEHSLMPQGVPYVVDYDDAVFHNYDLAGSSWVRLLLGSKIDRVMAKAATVICGNNYLADRALLAGASCIELVPTVVDADRYLYTSKSEKTTLVIGWIGSPTTQVYVEALAPVLSRIAEKHAVRLVLVGARPDIKRRFYGLPVDVLPWSEKTEAEQVVGFDIGIMPLTDYPWERGKCGYKLIQYMACGKPVIASPVGVNTQIVQNSECGLLADGYEQWFSALDYLLGDPVARSSYGRCGRIAVESHYSLKVQALRLVNILQSAAG